MAAPTVISEQVPPGPRQDASITAKLATIVFSAGDSVNGNKVIMGSERVLILVRNTGASAGTVSIASSKDAYGRKADIDAFSIAADAVVGRIFTPEGWQQVTGGRDLLITPSAATIEIAALRL